MNETLKYALRCTGGLFAQLGDPTLGEYQHPLATAKLYDSTLDLLNDVQFYTQQKRNHLCYCFEIVTVREVPGELVVEPVEALTTTTEGGQWALQSTTSVPADLFAGLDNTDNFRWTGLDPLEPILFATPEDALADVARLHLDFVRLVRVKEQGQRRELVAVL